MNKTINQIFANLFKTLIFISAICYFSACNTTINDTSEVLIENSCDTNIFPFRNDTSISDSNGLVKNINYMLPMELYPLYDSIGDTIHYNLLIKYYLNFKDQALFNFYQNEDIYRITILGTFGINQSYILKKNANKIFLIIKQINSIDGFFMNFNNKNKRFEHLWSAYSDTIILNQIFWNQFNDSIRNIHFYCMNPQYNKYECVDGGLTIVESHNKKGYYVVQFNCPKEFNLLKMITNISQKNLNKQFIINNIIKEKRKQSLGWNLEYINKEIFTESTLSSDTILFEKILHYNDLVKKNNINSNNLKLTKIFLDSAYLKLNEIIEIIKPYEKHILLTKSILN